MAGGDNVTGPAEIRDRSTSRVCGRPSACPAKPIRIVILTEDEPLFTADAFRTFFDEIGQEAKTVLVIMASFSPAGPKQDWRTTLMYFWRAFGTSAFLRVGLEYMRCRVHPKKRAASLLRRYGIPLVRTMECVNSNEVLSAVRGAQPDLIVSASVNSLFKPQFLCIAPCFNLHLSLLPRHKGLMPVFWALHDGDRETGATVFRVNSEIDGGEILVQKRVKIRERRLIPLYGELKRIGMIAMAEAIRAFKPGETGNLATGFAPAPLGSRKPGPEQLRRFISLGNRVI